MRQTPRQGYIFGESIRVGQGQRVKDRTEALERFPIEGQIKLPNGIYPKIIEPEVFEQVQRQLALNTEMSIRNNKYPQDTTLRGMIYCGICKHKMHVKHHAKVQPGRKAPRLTEYRCYINEGIDDLIHHHSIAIPAHIVDEGAWAFAIPYIKNPKLIREHVQAMKQQVRPTHHTESVEDSIGKINKSIASLYKLAEVADPDDEEAMKQLQERLVALQIQKRNLEKFHLQVASHEERQQLLLAAFDRFEEWAEGQRPFLDDPTYQPSQKDKIAALLILGVKATVWPATEEYEERVRFTLMPPDIARFCDYDFVQLSHGSAPPCAGLTPLCFRAYGRASVSPTG